MDGRPSRIKRVAFSNLSGLAWTGTKRDMPSDYAISSFLEFREAGLKIIKQMLVFSRTYLYFDSHIYSDFEKGVQMQAIEKTFYNSTVSQSYQYFIE